MYKKIKNIKGFIFDLDGTISLTQHLHYQAYAKVFKENKINYTRHEDQTMYAGKGSERTFTAVFEKHGTKLTKKEIKKLTGQKRKIYMKMLKNDEIKLVPGIENFLKYAAAKKIKLIIATGSRHEAEKWILKKTDLKKYFSQVLASSDVTEPKPSPQIFLLASKQIKLDPSQCIVFEDANMGINAAKAAKMICIGLATTLSKNTLKKAGADMAVKDYNELIKSAFFKNL